MPIRPFFKDAVFDPEVISAMGTAFEDVCKALAGRSEFAKETIADKILVLARGGEIDPIVLRDTVLSELGLSPLPKEP